MTVPTNGTFTLSAASGMTDGAGTRYRVNIDADDPEVAGQIAFETSGTLALNGAFEIIPGNPGLKIALGTRWTVGSISADVTSLARIRFNSVGMFRVYAEANAEDGWTIYAERRKFGIGILIR